MVKKIKAASIIFIITFAVLEGIVRLLPFERAPENYFKMNPISEVTKTDWYDAWTNDHSHMVRHFEAYEIYGLDPYPGKWLSIGQDGYRHTSYPGAERFKDASHVFHVGVSGGSTTWGAFARDEHTIPSNLGEFATKDFPSLPLKVTNYAEVGFVLSQELHRAVRTLYSVKEEGPHANLMVFVDGVNDVLSGIANEGHGVVNAAGKPWEFEKYQYLFQLGHTEVTNEDVVKKSKAMRLIFGALANLGLRKKEVKGIFIKPGHMDLEKLSSTVAEKYLTLVETTSKLLAAQGITTYFVLQPVIAFKSRSKTENEVYSINGEWLPYLKMTYEKISEGSKRFDPSIHFADLSHLFEGHSETLYSDVLHYSEDANRIIGAKIEEAIRPTLKIAAEKSPLLSMK